MHKDFLEQARTIPADQLPEFVGVLLSAMAIAFARMMPKAQVTAESELLTVEETAKKLRMSTDFVRRNAARIGRSRACGRALRFSASNVEKFMRK